MFSYLKNIKSKSSKRQLLGVGGLDGEEGENDDVELDEEHVNLQIKAKRWFTLDEDEIYIPHLIALPHPPISPETSICFITQDPHYEIKELIKEDPELARRITRVIGFHKLGQKYPTFEMRRQLMRKYDHFLMDSTVSDLVPKYLGRTFYAAQRNPIAIDVRGTDGGIDIERIREGVHTLLKSTRIQLRRGHSLTVRIGKTFQRPEHIVENIYAFAQKVLDQKLYIEAGWRNILYLHVRTHSSMEFPLWEANLDDLFFDNEQLEMRE